MKPIKRSMQWTSIAGDGFLLTVSNVIAPVPLEIRSDWYERCDIKLLAKDHNLFDAEQIATIIGNQW